MKRPVALALPIAVLALLLAASAVHAQDTAPALPPGPIGTCRFDPATLSFAGTPAEQAECLMQKVSRGGVLSPRPLPRTLKHLLEAGGGPSTQQAAAAIAAFPQPYRAYAQEHAGDPPSQTSGGVPLGYFVIHDTSMPFLGDRPFPAHLDRDPLVNDLWVYATAEPVAHVFLNRAGQIWPGHELAEGWRATKLESWVVGRTARGRMFHVETVQPRRHAPGSSSLADSLAPRPGFSAVQYRMLAALYVHASARAGEWLIPAQHAAIDGGIPDAHDDPQNFEVEKFAAEVARLTVRQRRR